MTTGAAVQQIGKGYFSKAKSFPVLKQRREGRRRSDFEKGSDCEQPPTPHPTLPMAYTDIPHCFYFLGLYTRNLADNNYELREVSVTTVPNLNVCIHHHQAVIKQRNTRFLVLPYIRLYLIVIPW